MARNHAVFAAIALGLLGVGASASAQSQECTQDTDCASGSWCVFDGGEATKPGVPVSDPACPPDDPNCASEPPVDVEPTKGTCEPLPKGFCVEDSDCSPGLECEIGTVGTDCAEPAPAPIDGGGAPEDAPIAPPSDCVPSEEPAPYGYCTLPTTVCTNDSMCLPGLTCVEPQSGGSSPGAAPACDPGGACDDPVEQEPAPQPEPVGDSTCQVSFKSCSADADCESGYECVEEAVACSSGGSVGSDGSSTGTVDPAQPKQRDPNCEYESYCFPKYTPCTADAQCQANWVCYSFDGDASSAPGSWEQDGPVQGCLPKGLALAAEAGYGRDSGGDGLAGGAPTGAPESDNASDDGVKGAAEPGSGDGNSCSVGFGPRGEGAAFLLMALGMLVRRRRTRA